MQIYNTSDAANFLGIKPHALLVWLSRHPQMKPARRRSGDDYLWSLAEIKQVEKSREQWCVLPKKTESAG